MLQYKPEVWEHNDVFAITLVNIDIRLTKTSRQVYKMRCLHPLATERTNATIWVLCPVYNAPAFNKKKHEAVHT